MRSVPRVCAVRAVICVVTAHILCACGPALPTDSAVLRGMAEGIEQSAAATATELEDIYNMASYIQELKEQP